jgi:hypothetical protein
MFSTTLSRVTGLAAIAGGILWIGANSALALRPPGIPDGAYRDDSGLGPYMVAAMLLIGAGMLGTYLQHTRHTGKLGRRGTFISLGGVAALLASTGAVAIAPDSWLVPILIIPGVFALVIGSLLASVALLRANALPRPVVLLLIASLLALLIFNTEDARAWFALPFGFAWIVLGSTLWSRSGVARTLALS